jgi:hypothetical protein
MRKPGDKDSSPLGGTATPTTAATRPGYYVRGGTRQFFPISTLVFGDRGSVAVRRLANLVTLCDGYEVFFVAASGQI